jgi:F-type H+-transporting ATPase subunit gamma
MASNVMGHLAADGDDYQHPLMEHREVRRRGLIVVGTDKGLCGALNSNLFRDISQYDHAATDFIAVGKKAAQFLARTRRRLVGEFSYHDTPTYGESQAISKFAQEMFLKGEVDAVDLLYTRFISTLSQRPERRPLLPLGSVESIRTEARGPAPEPAADRPHFDFLFEPDAVMVMDTLMVYLLDFRVAQVLLEAKASEHSARMVAMKNATDNANQLVKDLTLEYNKIRQASITKELLEISTAAMAMG